jgi:hypothetical protein
MYYTPEHLNITDYFRIAEGSDAIDIYEEICTNKFEAAFCVCVIILLNNLTVIDE